MLHQIIIATLLTVALSQNIPSFIRQANPRRPPCGTKCRFIFCVDRATVFLTAPGSVSNPEICRRNQEIDQVLRTGEALVSTPSGNVPISKWSPPGLDTPFSRNFFKAAEIFGEDNSGIQRMETKGNQNSFLRDRCFILPIRRYELVQLRRGKKIIRRINGRNPTRDCVAFIPKVADILFEAQWFSGDDLDLSVEEPDGTIVNFRNRKSQCGRLQIDANVDACDIRREGIERIFYNNSCKRLQRGLYTLRLRHATNCLLSDPPQDTDYEIRVVINGIVKRRVKGSSGKDDGQLITSFKFRV